MKSGISAMLICAMLLFSSSSTASEIRCQQELSPDKKIEKIIKGSLGILGMFLGILALGAGLHFQAKGKKNAGVLFAAGAGMFLSGGSLASSFYDNPYEAFSSGHSKEDRVKNKNQSRTFTAPALLSSAASTFPRPHSLLPIALGVRAVVNPYVARNK